MEKQLDMAKVIEKFFNSAAQYIEKMRALYVDKADLESFDRGISNFSELRKVAESLPNITDWNTRYGVAQKLSGMHVDAMLFMKPDSRDNSTYIAFRDFLYALSNYYQLGGVGTLREQFLAAYKVWCYKMSSNPLKDFIYPLVPASYFAKQAQKGTSR